MIPIASDLSWRTPLRHPSLGCDEVHVWRARLDRNATEVCDLQELLSAGERIRAGRYRFEKHRNRFIVARGLLRTILSRYQDTKPSALRFHYGPCGKPYLAITANDEPLDFNVSHSHGLALFAVTRGREVGVDLECIRRGFACETVAQQFFSPRENSILHALPTDELKHRAFFACWSRKEAYIKARGEGLSVPLDQFDVSLVPGEPAKLLGHRIAPQEVFRWSFQELLPDRSYAAAVVAAGQGWQLCCWDLI